MPRAEMMPAISVVVCTRNRSAILPEFFDALARLQCSVPWELIVVDNASTDDTLRVLTELAAQFPTSATIVSEPRPGLGRARNTGIRRARGNIIVFTDDDCYPAESYLDDMLAVFADENVGFMGGRILLHDPLDWPISIQTDSEVTPLPPHSVIETGLIQGANMAFRKRVLDAIGGFDESLGPGTLFYGEDIDAAARASAAGFSGGYFPGPTVFHHHRRRDPTDIARLWRHYDRGRGAYYAKCILDFPERTQWARFWLRSRALGRWRGAFTELAGAIDYCVRRATGRLG